MKTFTAKSVDLLGGEMQVTPFLGADFPIALGTALKCWNKVFFDKMVDYILDYGSPVRNSWVLEHQILFW